MVRISMQLQCLPSGKHCPLTRSSSHWLLFSWCLPDRHEAMFASFLPTWHQYAWSKHRSLVILLCTSTRNGIPSFRLLLLLLADVVDGLANVLDHTTVGAYAGVIVAVIVLHLFLEIILLSTTVVAIGAGLRLIMSSCMLMMLPCKPPC